MAAFKYLEEDQDFLNRMVLIGDYEKTHIQNLGNNGFALETGKNYTLLQLLEYMIIYSDNQSKDILTQHIPLHIIGQVFYDFGFDINKKDNVGQHITVKEFSIFLRVLYNATYLNKDYSSQALDILTRARFNLGLSAGVRKDVVVPHKFGERDNGKGQTKQLHDCSIVYVKDRPYILSIMASGSDFTKLEKTLKSISKLVYSHTLTNTMP